MDVHGKCQVLLQVAVCDKSCLGSLLYLGTASHPCPALPCPATVPCSGNEEKHALRIVHYVDEFASEYCPLLA